MPEYEGRVAFVDAVTSDPGSGAVTDRYAVRVIPTSVFIGADGQVAETVVGAFDAAEMRARLDALLAGTPAD
ncbi:MAG: hypothetical protein JXP37_06215 [Coriobacteriia bacterium]|nr:hypothetical protein [Coriobacteriia bacterium]